MESHPPIASGDTEGDLPDMRSDTQTISINAPAEKAFAFVADPGTCPARRSASPRQSLPTATPGW